MNKKIVGAIILCNLMIVGFVSATIPSVVARSMPDWPDGTFQGTWTHKDGDSGFLLGLLNQGRRATRGSFSADWNTTSGIEIGTMKGIFQGVLLAGQWTVNRGASSKMIGILLLNDTHFSARVFVSGKGMIIMSGTHDASFLPKLTGSYGVGVKSMHLVDESRPENFTASNTTDVREMMVQVWYPIETSFEGTRTEYMDYPTFQWLKGRSPIPLVTIPNDAYLFVRPHGRNDSLIASGMFPVVIFSPGYDGVYQIYTSFIEDLVSHGFVVASINHPYVSGITVFPDGRTVGLSDVPTDPIERSAFFNMSLRTIVGDAKFALDTMTEMNASDPDFLGHFDLSDVGMYGHSFGGANTAVCCYEDARFDAGLTLDGVFYQQFTPGNITVPFLYMYAENRLSDDSTVGYMWNHTTGDTFKMSIAGSTHYAFTDVGVLLSHLVPLIPPRLLSFGSIAPKRMVNITRTSVTVFFEVALKGEPLENLLSLPDQFPEVQLDYKLG